MPRRRRTVEAEELKANYARWRLWNRERRTPFFAVYEGIRPQLYAIKKVGAIKLYLTLGLHANNRTGEVYWSIERLADEMGVNERTVKSWFAELQAHGLIKRFRLRAGGVAHSYLVPYGPGSDEPAPDEPATHDADTKQ